MHLRADCRMYAVCPEQQRSCRLFDFARAIITSCTELTTLAIPGFTTTSCRQVRNALSATRIWKVGFTSSLTRLAASPAGTSDAAWAIGAVTGMSSSAPAITHANTIEAAEKYRIAHERLDAAAIRRRFPMFRVADDEAGYYEPSAGFLDVEECVRVQLDLARAHEVTEVVKVKSLTTDEIGLKSVGQAVDTYDLHATVLQLLGLDHLKTTFLNNGRSERPTVVYGKVIKDILA